MGERQEQLQRQLIGVWGGTFDPIHNAHLRLALEIKQQLHLAEMRLLPASIPPHKSNYHCRAEDRLAMVNLAVQSCSELMVDDRELKREGPSYSYDTLIEIRSELMTNQSLCWIMGSDSLVNFSSWYRWRELLDCAHIIVVQRPDYDFPVSGEVGEFLKMHQSFELGDLQASPAGKIFCTQLRMLPISSSDIRALLKDDRSPQFLLPDAVLDYIKSHKLYHP
ncbi:nicotinate-nucleotide adenylyltransferase [Sessilibacter sp. MAH1]